MENLSNHLSVIIPLAPNEKNWISLLPSLALLPKQTQIIMLSADDENQSNKKLLKKQKIIWLKSSLGRAKQMNYGAKIATGEYLWFLHADSQFKQQSLLALLTAIKKYPDKLLYFDLAFLKEASFLMYINTWGCYLRSRFLGIPFGDQGFCLHKKIFAQLGGFNCDVHYGEDHLLIWKARQLGIKIQAIKAPLYTSARKYQKNGWLKTTLKHQYLWIKQAYPEWKKLKNNHRSQS